MNESETAGKAGVQPVDTGAVERYPLTVAALKRLKSQGARLKSQ